VALGSLVGQIQLGQYFLKEKNAEIESVFSKDNCLNWKVFPQNKKPTWKVFSQKDNCITEKYILKNN
jgi:hypothetical protein